MTIGQRITAKRKELALSQEALGEQLGVSRQAIYKWESDATLPEIEKLITMSRLFGVSVGWLLGVEELPETAGTPEPADSGELNESQLNMVEEIVARYLEAQPKPKAKKWLMIAATLALLAGSFSIIDRLDQIDQQYHRIQMTVTHVQDSVNLQINSITDRVEEALKSQNLLTADYHVEYVSAALEKNEITFSAQVIPKTYTEGMTAEFLADDGTGNLVTVPCEADENQTFSSTITCQLTDDIDLSVVFVSADGTRSTQLLENFAYLYSNSLPSVSLNPSHLWGQDVKDGMVQIQDMYIPLRVDDVKPSQSKPMAGIDTIQPGLFLNNRLVAWAVPCSQPSNYRGFEEHSFFQIPNLELPVEPGDTLITAALITDTYGRQTMSYDYFPLTIDEGDQSLDWNTDNYTFESDPAKWDFTPMFD